MAYIGRQNLGGAYRQLDDISSGFDGSDTTHTMQVNSANVTVGDVNQIILSLGGVIQKPGTDFTVSGSVLTFTTAPAANTSFFAVLLGSDNGGTVTPTDGSVTTSKFASGVAIGATGTANTLAGIPFFSDSSNSSMYTHDVSGTDDTAQYNTAFGFNALDAITTGDKHVAIGYNAGTAVTEAVGNVLIGEAAGAALTTGGSNTLIGRLAGDAFDTEANNIAIGVAALGGSVAGGEYNVAVGNYTLDALTSGDNNTAIGYNAGSANQSGADTVYIGYQAGTACTSSGNVLIGKDAGLSMTSGESNIHIGIRAGDGYDTESNNLSIGADALGGSVAGGEYNVAVGNFAGDAITSADSCTAVGYAAGSAITTGTDSVCIGESAGGSITTGQGNVMIGQNSGNAGTSLTTGANNIFIGEKISSAASGTGNSIVLASASEASKGDNTGFINPNGGGVYQGNNSTSWSQTSDIRIKKNIKDNNTGLDAINKIRVRNFEYRTLEEITDFDNPKSAVVKKEGTQLGAIAQEIEEILPDLITETSQGVKTLDADNLTWYLINAVKELSKEVNKLKEDK